MIVPEKQTLLLNKRFEVTKSSPILEGGMASIFQAVDTSTGIDVIVKVNTNERVHNTELHTMMIIR